MLQSVVPSFIPTYRWAARLGLRRSREFSKQSSIDLVFDRPPVEPELPPGLLIAPSLGVDQRAVAPPYLFGAQRAGENLVGDPLSSRRARCVWRPVLATDHHVAHAPLELTDVAGPAVAVAEVPTTTGASRASEAPADF